VGNAIGDYRSGKTSYADTVTNIQTINKTGITSGNIQMAVGPGGVVAPASSFGVSKETPTTTLEDKRVTLLSPSDMTFDDKTNTMTVQPSDSQNRIQKIQSGADVMLLSPTGQVVSRGQEGLGGLNNTALANMGYKTLPLSQLTFSGDKVIYNEPASLGNSINTSNTNYGGQESVGGSAVGFTSGIRAYNNNAPDQNNLLSVQPASMVAYDNSRVSFQSGKGTMEGFGTVPIIGSPVRSNLMIPSSIDTGQQYFGTLDTGQKLGFGYGPASKSILPGLSQMSYNVVKGQPIGTGVSEIFYGNVGKSKQTNIEGLAAGKSVSQIAFEKTLESPQTEALMYYSGGAVLGGGVGVASKFASPGIRSAGTAVGYGLAGLYGVSVASNVYTAPDERKVGVLLNEAVIGVAGYSGFNAGLKAGRNFSPKQYNLPTSGSKPFTTTSIKSDDFSFDVGASKQSTVSQVLDNPITPERARAVPDMKFEYGTASARNVNEGTMYNIPVTVTEKGGRVKNIDYSAMVVPSGKNTAGLDTSAYAVVRTNNLNVPDNTLIGIGKSQTLFKAEVGTTPQTKNFQIGDTLASFTEPYSVKNEMTVTTSLGLKDTGAGGIKLSNSNSAFENIKVLGDEKQVPNYDIWHRTESVSFPTSSKSISKPSEIAQALVSQGRLKSFKEVDSFPGNDIQLGGYDPKTKELFVLKGLPKTSGKYPTMETAGKEEFWPSKETTIRHELYHWKNPKMSEADVLKLENTPFSIKVGTNVKTREYTDYGFSTIATRKGKGSILPESIFSVKTRDLMTGEPTSIQGGYYKQKMPENSDKIFSQIRKSNPEFGSSLGSSGTKSRLVGKTKTESIDALPSSVTESINADVSRISKTLSTERYGSMDYASANKKASYFPKTEYLGKMGRSGATVIPAGFLGSDYRRPYASGLSNTGYTNLGKFKPLSSSTQQITGLGTGSQINRKVSSFSSSRDIASSRVTSMSYQFKLDTGIKQRTVPDYALSSEVVGKGFEFVPPYRPPPVITPGLPPSAGWSGLSGGMGMGTKSVSDREWRRQFRSVKTLL
jgi:hypothetical protein